MDMGSVEQESMDMNQMGTSMGKGMEMKGMQHDVSPAPPAEQNAGSGRTEGRNFRFLGTDIANSPALAVDGMDPSRPWPPYDELRSVEPTAFTADRQVREIRLTLDGDMERYVWFLNKKVLTPLSSTPSTSLPCPRRLSNSTRARMETGSSTVTCSIT